MIGDGKISPACRSPHKRTPKRRGGMRTGRDLPSRSKKHLPATDNVETFSLGSPMVLPEAHEEGDSIHPNQVQGADAVVPSPFLEGTKIQYAWDSTSLEALKKCPRYYQLTMIDNWQLRGDAIHLRWGQEFHYAIEDYEHSRAAKLSHDDSVFDTVRTLVGRIEGWEPAPRTKSEELKSKENLL